MASKNLCTFSFYSVQTLFNFPFLKYFLWPMDYLKVCFLVSKFCTQEFSKNLWLLISNLITLLSENILCKTWILLHLLRLVLWVRIWPTLINTPCVLQHFSMRILLLDRGLYKCQSSTLIVLFKSTISLLSVHLFYY